MKRPSMDLAEQALAGIIVVCFLLTIVGVYFALSADESVYFLKYNEAAR